MGSMRYVYSWYALVIVVYYTGMHLYSHTYVLELLLGDVEKSTEEVRQIVLRDSV